MRGRIVVKNSKLTDVRILEDESLVELILQPIHLRANNAEQSLGINQNLDAILLDRLVKSTSLVHVFKMVRQTRASSVANAQAWLQVARAERAGGSQPKLTM